MTAVVIRRIRAAQGPLASMPAVALTAFASVDDQTRALEAGFDVHVTKPVEPGLLVRQLLWSLARHRPAS